MKNQFSFKSIAFVALAAICMLVANDTQAQSKKLSADKNKTTVVYAATHPMHDWEGTNHKISSAIMYDPQTKVVSSVAVLMSVANFDSQNANRDSHMIEVLEGIKYPNISFSSSSVKMNGEKITVTGTLSFHGVPKVITFEGLQKTEGSNLVVTGTFDVKMTDYKIEAPTLMGIATDDLIKISFTAYYPL